MTFFFAGFLVTFFLILIRCVVLVCKVSKLTNIISISKLNKLVSKNKKRRGTFLNAAKEVVEYPQSNK